MFFTSKEKEKKKKPQSYINMTILVPYSNIAVRHNLGAWILFYFQLQYILHVDGYLAKHPETFLCFCSVVENVSHLVGNVQL